MKKINLIKRLWTDSHEKQSPQRFGRYAAMLIMLLTLGVGQMWADNAVTVYCAINASTMKSGDDCYTLKVNANIGDGGTWRQYTMNIVDKTKNGKLIYSATIYEKYGGVDALQFQLYQGSTWKAQKQPYSSWTTSSTFSGKMYDYDAGSWGAYSSLDAATTVYFVNTSSWGTPKAFAWSGCTNNAAWSGQTMTSTGKTYNGKTIYSISFNKRFENIIFSNNGSSQTADLTLGSTNAGKMYDNGTWRTYNYDVTVSFNLQGHGSAIASKTVVKGSKVTAPSDPSASGYTFGGWYKEAGCTNAWNFSSDAVSADTELFAKWTENMSTVSFVASPTGKGTFQVNSSTVTSTTAGVATTKDVTAVPGTGYTFGSWAITGGATISSTSTNPTTVTGAGAGADATLTCTFNPKTYSITLDGNGGSDGSATATYNSSTLTSVTGCSRPSYDLNGYYTATSGGTKVINANGTLVASAGSYTNSSSQWIYDGDVELHAQWTYNPVTYSVTYAVGTGYTSYGSLSAKNSSTSAVIASGSSVESGTGITFTATPNTGYEVAGFYSDASCETLLQSGNTTTYTIASLSSAVTVYVKFVEKTWSVAFAAGTGGTVTTPAATPQTVGQVTGISIEATPATGYTFNSWSSSSGGSFTSGTSTNSNTFKPTANTTVTASFNETKSTITVTTATSSQGTLKFGSTDKSWGTTASLGVATTQEITATAAAGFTFVRWDLSGAAASASTLTNATITLKADGSGSTGTATAVFAEDLSSPWIVAGGNKIVTTGTTWRTTADANNSMIKKTGHSTESIVYFTVPVTTVCSGDNNGNFQFKIYNTSTSKWYGLAATGDSYYLLKAEDGTEKSLVEGNKNIELRAYVTGDYEFKLDYSTSTPKLTVTWPVFNQVRISAASPTDATNVGNFDMSDPVSNVRTVTRSLKANTTYTFKIMYNSDWYGYNSGTFTRSTSTSSNSRTLSTSGGNLTLTTDYAGDYTFRFNQSTKALSVDFPTAYKVTYGKGTVDGSTGSCSAKDIDNGNAAVTSNSTWVKSGNRVVLTAPVAKTGYTYNGWFDNNSGTGAAITTNANCTITVSSALTRYACYTEDMHTVTLNSTYASGHVEIGGETVTSTSAGIATASPTITAVPELGYYFTGWTGSDINNGVTIASGSTSTASITIRATADSKSITANFARRWVLAGDWLKDGGGQWDHTTNTLYPNPAGYGWVQISNLAANTEYAFKLYDNTGATHWVGYASSGQVYDYDTYRAVAPADSILVNTYSGNAITLKTAAKGNYSFYYNFNTHKLYVYFPQSRKISMGVYTKSDGTSSAYTGGTISAVDNDENVITDGLYVSNNGSVTFTATPKAGYIWRGWYSNIYCTGDPVATERTHTVSSITSDVIRYALFEETLYSVKVHRNDAIETTYKVGIDSHPTINAATAPTGKIFDRWVTTGSATVEDPYASTTKITGATDDVSTVTATFKELPKIYIDLTSATGWNPSNMYVVFYKSGGYFDGTNGTGLSSTYVITPTPLEMTRMGTSKIWYYSYDPTSGDFAGKTITCVAFVDHTFAANYGNFTSATVVYRTDFSSCMNMFVVTDNTGTNKNESCYYRNSNAISDDATKGYWRKYEENNSGFYVNNLPGGSVEFTNEDGGNTYTARVNLDANTTYYFYLGCCNGWNWSNDQTTLAFNSDNRTRMVQPYNDVSSDGLRCKLTTTAAGYYTFSLTPQNTRQVQLSVDFPVAANDYRAVYNNAASSPTISRPSNIIKSDQNSGTISLWLNKGTNYISFQKATLGAGGAVSWTACGSQQTVTGVAEAGIYTMTLTRDGSTYTVSTPEKYEGDLYIRTDCAPGKWADYTENKLEENAFNFKADDASTFDYYYCKWVNDAGTNVKCVIANEINVALSDTLKGESILVSVGQPSNETLPEGANVRFSYNSVTNTLKRSYLTGSATDVFLNIIPDNEEEVYQTDGTTDMHGDAGAKNKFSDLGNWVYVLNAKVKPGATAAVKANYNSTSQELIAEETTLLGGTEDVLYEIRLIYDFKTNYLMSAWMPSGNVDEAISLNSDIMIVRRGQNDANQLSFSDDGELTDVKRAYGVFEFRKTDMVTHMGSWNDYGYTYGLCMYYFSLPFDVNVSDIFGVGTMGDDWRIQFYNGKKRAEKGWFAGDGTTTFWEDVPADTVLYAYEGYLLMLNRSHFNNGSHKVWNNVTTSAYLYFPSTEPVYALDSIEKPITVPSHECTIDRFFTQDSLEYYDSETKQWKTGARNHKYVDSHWNMMGTPLFRNKAAKSIEACKVKIGEADSTLNYVYEWVPSTNSLSARQVLNTSFTFKPMFAYMVQYAGKVTFEGAAIKPAEIAARRSSEHKQYTVELELTKENQFAGRTYIELRENAVDSFMLNEDMYIMKGSKVADIYTHADGYELAANVLTINSHIVPVSVDTKSAGTYTFSMPSNFSGTVILIDKYANTRVNLAYEDYEVYLEQGAIKDRFEVEININDAPTAIDGAADGEGTLKDGKAHKFIMNDMMYILKDGVLYDARGNRVK